MFNDAIKIWCVDLPNDRSNDNIEFEKVKKEIKSSSLEKNIGVKIAESEHNVTNSKPTKLTIQGRDYNVKTWKDVLVQTLNFAADFELEKTKKFIDNSQTLTRNKKNKFRNVGYLNNKYPIETGHAAKTIYEICTGVIDEFNLPATDWVIEYIH